MMTRKFRLAALLLTGALALASREGQAAGDSTPVVISEAAQFEDPWAIAFLPGRHTALVTEKRGRLMLWEDGSEVREVAGVPRVDAGGQGGLGDVILSPRFAEDRLGSGPVKLLA